MDDASARVRDISARIFDALADERWTDAIGIAEESIPELLSFAPAMIRIVADAVPSATLRRRPRWFALRQYVAHLLASPGKPPIFPGVDVETPEHVPAADRIPLLTGRAASLRTQGRFDEAAAVAQSAHDAAQALPDADARDLRVHLPVLLLQWGVTLAAAGNLLRAASLVQEAHTAAEETGNVRAAREACGELAWIHALLGAGAEADLWLARAERLAARHPEIRLVRCGAELAAAYRASDRLDFARCLEALDEDGASFEELWLLASALRAIVSARARSLDPLVALSGLEVDVESSRARFARGGLNAQSLAVARGTLRTYQGLHEAALLALAAVPDRPRSGEGLMRTRRAVAMLGLGDSAGALREASRERANPAPRVRAEAFVVRAAALLRIGDEEGARADVRTARTIVDANGLPASLAVVSAPDLASLARVTEAPLAFDDSLMHERVRTPAAAYRYERLTTRQLVLLRAVARHERLADAAAEVGVSLNTAKSHVRAAYRRLGVSDRPSALAEGHRRGLL